jgi:hypothetical protein
MTMMRFLRRFGDEQRRPGNGDGGSASGDLLQQLSSEGDRLLAAGDEAIQRALATNNSEAFLRAGRQQGGE